MAARITKNSHPRTNNQLVLEALRAAEQRDRERVLALTDGVRLGEDAGAPIDERWLVAERAYLHGEYENAGKLFGDLEADNQFSELRPWQRFQSLHRHSFSALQLGDFEASQELIARADTLRQSEPSLSSRESDVMALHAHLAELVDDFESARTHLTAAYENAVANRVWERAATAAADLVRISGIVGDPPEGLAWATKAREVLSKRANERVERTLRLREGMMYTLLSRDREALEIFADLIKEAEKDSTASGLLVDILGRRADLHRRQGRSEQAKVDLRRALALAEEKSLRRHAVYLELDFATLYLEEANPDPAAAYDHFLRAVGLLEHLSPPPRRLLRQLAEIVVGEPRLIGRARLPAPIASELAAALRSIAEMGKPAVYQRGSWDRRAAQAYEQLRRVLMGVLGPPVRLRSGVEIHLDSGKVSRSGGFAQLQPAQVRLLRFMLDHGHAWLTIDKMAVELGDTSSAVQKNIERIRRVLGSDLETQGAGRAQRQYRLCY